MSFNTFGKFFRFTTWGESHGPAIGCIIDGCPPLIQLKEQDIQRELDKDSFLTSHHLAELLAQEFPLQINGQEPEGEVIKEEEKEKPTFVQFMKRIDQLPEVTREAIKNCGNDPAIAKAALEISGIDK